MDEDDKSCGKIDTMAAIKVLTIALMALGMGLTFVYKPVVDDIETLRKEVIRIESDPRPKPETKIEMQALGRDVNKLGERIEKLEDRINALHQFLLQNRPSYPMPKKNDFEVNR